MEEEWRDVYGFDGIYNVSNAGRVRSLPREVRTFRGFRMIKGRVRKLKLNKDGYLYVELSVDGQQTSKSVHSLVFEAFKGGPVADGKVIAHDNKLKQDNRPENLVAMTISDSHALNYRLGVSTERGIGARTKVKARELDQVLGTSGTAQVCRICKRELPIVSFAMKQHGYPERTCKDCRATKSGIVDVGKMRTAMELLKAGLRKCGRCRQVMPFDKFGKFHRGLGGLRSTCKKCYR